MKVLAYTSPARGHLFPAVPILDELAARGHQVSVRTLASEVGLMSARGFDAAPIAPSIEALVHTDYEARTPSGKLKRGLETFAARGLLEIGDLRDAIADVEPDFLLVDTAASGAGAAAEAWGGPWAQWFPYPMPLRSPGIPPYGPGFRPAAGPAAGFRDRVVGRLAFRAVEKASLPGFNRVREAAGVPAFESLDDVWIAPPLVLYMTAEPFEYPRAWPENVRMIGSSSWDPPAEAPAWLAEVDRPIVLVSTSSEFQDDGKLVAVALEALADEDVQVVATLPSAELPGGRIPANARVERFVPHSPILARAACAITHGGAGVTQKALAAGVPVCVVPFGRDQFEVARRVEVAGAGTRLPAPRLSAGRLRKQVLKAMTLADGARRVAAGYAGTGGSVAAADAVEELFSENAASSPERSCIG